VQRPKEIRSSTKFNGLAIVLLLGSRYVDDDLILFQNQAANIPKELTDKFKKDKDRDNSKSPKRGRPRSKEEKKKPDRREKKNTNGYTKKRGRKEEESSSDEEEYEVEEVLHSRGKNNRTFLVKWVGYEQTTWEPVSCCLSNNLQQQEENIPASLIAQFDKKGASE